MAEQFDDSDELLRRALLDAEATVAVALRIDGLALADELTIVFHGRRDLGTLQTYVANGGHGAGAATAAPATCCASRATSISRAPTRATRPRSCTPRRRARCATRCWPPTPCSLCGASRWPELAESEVELERSVELTVDLPAPRLMPVALVAPERQLTVAPVCGARTLAEGRPPLGIVCAQQDVAHVYPLPDDPEACLIDFHERAAEHARRTAERLDHQEASVRRFMEISGEDSEAA